MAYCRLYSLFLLLGSAALTCMYCFPVKQICGINGICCKTKWCFSRWWVLFISLYAASEYISILVHFYKQMYFLRALLMACDNPAFKKRSQRSWNTPWMLSLCTSDLQLSWIRECLTPPNTASVLWDSACSSAWLSPLYVCWLDFNVSAPFSSRVNLVEANFFFISNVLGNITSQKWKALLYSKLATC